MIVLDASAVLELLLRTGTGARVALRIGALGESLHAPQLLDLEVAQVLRRYESMGTLSPDEAKQALVDFSGLDISRYPHDPFLFRIWELRSNHTVYDACYVALAETLQAPLLTCDTRLAASPGHVARVELP